ncbi:M91 family zinc metallopeptidase [Lentzea kentuckyensis]|uniref:M91 family zinc metallopeptidase n=1 Tax=Lentzea kentuckyensis TaxID=360086 RepID=UPI000A3C3F2B|nr:M91 family zinc metallopeptidase [Lentzea kentuckyensis]
MRTLLALALLTGLADPQPATTAAITITNNGDRPCAVAALPDGAVRVSAGKRDGVALTPLTTSIRYIDDLGTMIARDAEQLAPGAQRTIRLDLVDRALLSVRMTPEPTADRWAVDVPGDYEFALAYQFPDVPGAPRNACAGAEQTVRFTVAAPAGQQRWWWIGGGALLGVLLLALVIALLARRNRTAAAFVLAAVVLAALVSPAPPAHAQEATVDGCLDLALKTGDAGLKEVVDYYRAHKGDIKIKDFRDIKDPLYDSTLPDTPDHLYTPGKPTGSTIRWDPRQTSKALSGGAMRDNCSSLLHELFHAKEYLTGEAKGSKAICGPDAAPLEVDEVKATHLENKFRTTLPKNSAGQPPTRPTYDNKPLPSQKSCDETTRLKPERPRKPEQKNEEQPEKDCEECAGSDGDPHLYTFDRRFYSFQAAGEFVLVKGDGMEIQVRQQPFEDSTTVSVNTAVAVSAAGQKQMIRGAGKVAWPDGSALWVTPIGAYGLRVQVLLSDARKGKVSGLLGNYDGDKDNDVDDDVYGAFADRWRVKDSLFDYEPGKNTDSYTDRRFPSRQTSLADVPERDQAEQTCRAAGVTQQPFLDACVLDVGLTGKADFATSAAATQLALRKPVPPADTKQDLRVSAPFDRQVTAAATDCFADGDQLTLLFYESDLELSVTLTKDFRGPGEYALGSILSNSGIVTLTSRNTGYLGSSSADAGKLTMSADGRSGTIDLAVTDHAAAPVRVTGSWACKEVRAG